MIKKKLRLPIYNQFTIIIIFTDDIPEQVYKHTKYETEDSYDALVFYRNDKETTVYVAFDDKTYTQGIIAHECFHIVRIVMDYVGIPLTKESEEAYTYLLGYLVDEVNKLIK